MEPVISDIEYQILTRLSTSKRTADDTAKIVAYEAAKKAELAEELGKIAARINQHFNRYPIMDPAKARERAGTCGIRTPASLGLDATKEALLQIQGFRDLIAPCVADYASAVAYLKTAIDNAEKYACASGLALSEWELKALGTKFLGEWPDYYAEVSSTAAFLFEVWKNLSYQTGTVSRVQSVHESEIRLGTMGQTPDSSIGTAEASEATTPTATPDDPDDPFAGLPQPPEL